MNKHSFLDILKQKVIVFDGAMGVNIQAQNLTPDDFGGEKYEGCNEYLVLKKPSAIERIHNDFLEVGCDVIETDSFGSTPIVLAEYGLSDQAYTLNVEAAKLAKRIASDYSINSQPRFVAGSMGPTTKLPSLGHINFKDMEATYYIQAKGLVEGGVDRGHCRLRADPFACVAGDAFAGLSNFGVWRFVGLGFVQLLRLECGCVHRR